MAVSRRLILGSLLLQGCTSPLRPLSAAATQPAARALLARSASAHGSLASIADVSVGYAGEWHGLVDTLQPALVDADFRGRSEERLLLGSGVVAQAHVGPKGSKQVVRRTARAGQGDVSVWRNGVADHDEDSRAAAALVADGYALFLLGPMLLDGPWASERVLVMEQAGVERLDLDGRGLDCDVLRLRMAPGFGLSERDEMAVFLGRDDGLMRRVRFTLNGLDGTRGAVAEVDTLDHVTLAGVRWPTRFHERLLRPLPLPVHDWQLAGLDVNRGFVAADVGGAIFAGNAVAPAAALR